jgi:hypothetical protein
MEMIPMSVLIGASQADIVVPVRLSSHMVLGPSFGFVFVGNVGTDYRYGLLSRIFLSDKPVKPFLGCRGGIIVGHRIGSESMTDRFFGIMAGAEYFINEYISTGVEGQLNATFSSDNSSRFGNPGKHNVNTATALYVTLYF